MIARGPDGETGATYAGTITSLVRLDDIGDFTFSGVIGETTRFFVCGQSAVNGLKIRPALYL
jgi:hypothetical protein